MHAKPWTSKRSCRMVAMDAWPPRNHLPKLISQFVKSTLLGVINDCMVCGNLNVTEMLFLHTFSHQYLILGTSLCIFMVNNRYFLATNKLKLWQYIPKKNRIFFGEIVIIFYTYMKIFMFWFLENIVIIHVLLKHLILQKH